MDIAGAYSDTLPCSDCMGILTELIIQPDTTFVLRERYLGDDGRPQKSNSAKGVYTWQSEGNKIKLTSSSPDFAERFYEVSNGNLTATGGSNATGGRFDLTLDLQEKTIGKKGSEFVMQRTKPFTKYPVQVFNYITGNDIHIHSSFLSVTSEAEKAIIAYYAIQYNSGCDDSGCALLSAMNLDITSAAALVNKWMPTAKLGSDDVNRESRGKNQLAMLFFVKSNDGLQVKYNLTDATRQMSIGSDEFNISNTEVTFKTKGELKAQSKPTINTQRKEIPKRELQKNESVKK